MPSYSEDDMRQAIEEVESGTFSVRTAAKRHGVPRTSLQNRLNGSMPANEAHHPERKLSQAQEEALAAWIRDLDGQGQAPSHAFAKRMAEAIAGTPLGSHWVPRFLKRNGDGPGGIATRREYRVHHNRLEGAHLEVINTFFDALEAAVEAKGITPANTWNFDETGIAQGLGVNGLVIGALEKRRIYVKESGDREWVTILHAISAEGRFTKPAVIFKGLTLQAQWFPDDIPEFEFSTSQNGWTNSEIALH